MRRNVLNRLEYDNLGKDFLDLMEKLSDAATKSVNCVVIADKDGRIEWVNEGFTNLTGYTIDDVKGTHGEVLSKGQSTGLSRETNQYEAVIRGKKPVTYENKNFKRNGDEYWALTTLTPVLGEDGEVERIIAIDSDITERKVIEEELVLANKIAEHSLRKGHKALNELLAAKKELEEMMRVKEQFLAKMSHEIRTPMNAIIGMSELIRETPLSPEQQEYVNAIKLSADNLLEIINDILDFSKIQSGTLTFEMRPFRLDEVVNGVIQTMHFSAEKKGVRLEATLAKDLPAYLNGDALRLRQVLLNLVGNALKFTPSGSVHVDVALKERDEKSCTLVFTVSDTGIGIAEDSIGSIFDSFNQASNETSRKYGGSGLGLTIVKQLVEFQEGTVDVKSKPGEGSTFVITLPFETVTEAEIPCTGPDRVAEMPSGDLSHASILLVEDNELNQLLAKKMMVRWKAHVDVASNGIEALRRLRSRPYDLVLMDIQMPEMDGYETTRYIREKFPEPDCRIPIIAMTAHAIVGEAGKCLAAGMNDYLSKPFNPSNLFRKIAAFVPAGNKEEKRMTEIPENEQPGSIRHSDLAYLRQIAEGSNDFIATMIKTFLAQNPPMMDEMAKAVAERRWNDLRGLAHKMKPTCDFMGLHTIRDTVHKVEELAGEEKELDRLPGMVGEIIRSSARARAELEQVLTTIR